MRKDPQGRPRKKKSQKHDPTPETADEFLAVGVDFEEAGEKWRAGDAVKSTRFFRRAIDNYDEALRRFPDSFDVAYNKARVQFQITQYPKLAAQMSAPHVDLLRAALQTHREALRLKQENADVLFNTAQVLTSLAESLLERRLDPEKRAEALTLLQEAVELFQSCLLIQEYEFSEAQAQRNEAATSLDTPMAEDATPGEVTPEHGGPSVESDQWASILEPVTTETLLDACLAQLETLRTICGLVAVDSNSILGWVEEYTNDTLDSRITAYAQGRDDRSREVALARANFVSALSEAKYRSGRINLPSYQTDLARAISREVDLHDDPEALCARADAFMSLASAVADSPVQETAAGSGDQHEVQRVRWKYLTWALDDLTAASRLPSAQHVAKIHLSRGDVEMLRFQLGNAPSPFEPARNSRDTLLQNAEVFYRGAAGFASRTTDSADEEREARVKEAVAASLRGDGAPFTRLMAPPWGVDPDAHQVITDAQEEGVIPNDWEMIAGVGRPSSSS
ncbi:MAG: hypothetical protein M1837_002785 [Sclerophora amabilis]|nr:MAG: hypothetical protein M1837_002785 [Sclerophora amabilis]